jgi:hypothetical protein
VLQQGESPRILWSLPGERESHLVSSNRRARFARHADRVRSILGRNCFCRDAIDIKNTLRPERRMLP